VRLDRFRRLFQERAAFGEGQRTQRRPAFSAGVVQRRGEVEAVTRNLGKRLFGSGIEERLRRARSFDPALAEVAAQRLNLELRCFLDWR
jgi:hypothetical protein